MIDFLKIVIVLVVDSLKGGSGDSGGMVAVEMFLVIVK